MASSINATSANSFDAESQATTTTSDEEEHENEEHDASSNDHDDIHQDDNDLYDVMANICHAMIRPLKVILWLFPLVIFTGVLTGDWTAPMTIWTCFAIWILCLAMSFGNHSPHDQSVRQILQQRHHYYSYDPVPHLSKEKMMELLVPISQSQQEVMTSDCCEICLNEWNDDDEIIDSCSRIVASPNPECNHVYHLECILQWLQHHPTCPCCRAEYLPTIQDDDSSLHDTEHVMEQGDQVTIEET